MPKNPICPRCNVAMKPASYGMRVPGPDDDEFYDMGCLMDIPMVTFGCSKCHFEIFQDGTTRSPAPGESEE